MNLCIFEGYLTRDPELRTAPGPDDTQVSVLAFSIGINNRRNKTSFPNLEAWAQGAETIARWFKKGDLIRVFCEHITDSWEDKTTGQKRYKDKFRVDRFEFPPINKGRDKGEDGEAPDAGENAEDSEAPETPKATPAPTPAPAPSPKKPADKKTVAPAPARKARQTVPVEEGDDDIPF